MANPPIQPIPEIGNDLVSALKELARCEETYSLLVDSAKIAAKARNSAKDKYCAVLVKFEFAVLNQRGIGHD